MAEVSAQAPVPSVFLTKRSVALTLPSALETIVLT